MAAVALTYNNHLLRGKKENEQLMLEISHKVFTNGMTRQN